MRSPQVEPRIFWSDKMALWIVHLRIADNLLKRFPSLSPREFVYGNLAPDAGVRVEGNYVFSPTKEVSHFQYKDPATGHNLSGDGRYLSEYLNPEKIAGYTPEELSFHLGYFTHLLSDRHWSTDVVLPIIGDDYELYSRDKAAYAARFKADFYAVDCQYLREHKNFGALEILKENAPFKNIYLGFFPEDAFEKARIKIIDTYSDYLTAPDTSGRYMSAERTDEFVERLTDEAAQTLEKFI